MDPELDVRAAAVTRWRRDESALTRFLVVAYALSYAGQAAIWVGGGLEGRLFRALAPLLMFTPALAAWFACRSEATSFVVLLRPPRRWPPIGVAILVPAINAIVAAFAIERWLGGAPPPWQRVPGGYAVPEAGPFLWKGTLSLPALVGDIAATALVLSVLAGLLAVGEEIGWRGYLQPRLCRRLGTGLGLTATGLLWAFWHLPLLLLGYVFPAAPVLGGLLLFPLVGVGLSFFLGWLREATDGIWGAVLAHGCYNAFFGSLVFGMETGERPRSAYLVIVAISLLTGLAAVPLLRPTRREVRPERGP